MNLKLENETDYANIDNETCLEAPVSETISYSIILPIFAVFGLTGNLIIIFVYMRRKRERQQTIAVNLTCAAVCDSLMLILAVAIFTGARQAHFAVQQIPQLFASAQTFSTLSVWIDCYITFERFAAVCHPMRHRRWFSQRRKTIIALALITLIAILYELPRYWEIDVAWIKLCSEDPEIDAEWSWIPDPMPIRNSDWFARGKLLVGYLTLNFAGPFIWQLVLNALIVVQIRKSQKFHHQLNGTSNINHSSQHSHHYSKAERSTTIMLIAYSFAFLILQLPATLLNIFEFTYVGIFSAIGKEWTGIIEQVSNLLITLNSCTNFYIFLLFGSRFRHLVRRKFEICFSRNKGKHVQFDVNSCGTSTPMVNLGCSNSTQQTQNFVLKKRESLSNLSKRSSIILTESSFRNDSENRRSSLL